MSIATALRRSASCNGCHYHGNRSLKATTSKTVYAPGETVSVTLTSGSTRSGWIKANLYNQSNTLVATSSGTASGMGGATTFPATLTAAAPTAPGTYTWKMAYYGNNNGTGSGDVHSEAAVSTNSFTVAAPADTAAPTVSAFTLPATSTSLTVPVSTLTASDNVAVTGYLVTTSAAAPAASAAGWSAAKPTSVTAPGEGNVTFYAWARDAAGNVSASRSAAVVVTITLADTAAPTVSAFTLPATSTSLTVPVSSLTATDNVAVTGYLITTSSAAPAASAAGWSAAPTSVTAPGEGSDTFYAWARDAAGNVSASRSAAVTITLPDTAAPTVSTFTLPATATSLTVPVSSLTASDNVAVTGYLITKSAAAPAASAAGWNPAKPTSVTAPGAGNVTFYAWARDAAGNVSASRSAAVTVTLPDTAAPTVSTFTLPATSTSLTVPVTTLTATDNVAVTGYLITTSATAPAASAAGWSAATDQRHRPGRRQRHLLRLGQGRRRQRLRHPERHGGRHHHRRRHRRTDGQRLHPAGHQHLPDRAGHQPDRQRQRRRHRLPGHQQRRRPGRLRRRLERRQAGQRHRPGRGQRHLLRLGQGRRRQRLRQPQRRGDRHSAASGGYHQTGPDRLDSRGRHGDRQPDPQRQRHGD